MSKKVLDGLFTDLYHINTRKQSDAIRKMKKLFEGKQAAEIVPKLIEYIENRDNQKNIRKQATEALALWCSKEAKDMLTKIIKAPKGSYPKPVIEGAIRALPNCIIKNVVHNVIEHLENKEHNKYLRTACANVLPYIDGNDAILSLRNIMNDLGITNYIRCGAICALSTMKAKQVVDDLNKLIKNNNDPEIVKNAQNALYHINKP